MRHYFGIIVAVIIVLLVLIGLSAISYVSLDRPAESEGEPNRSSYNTGPTGTRAFYQVLEESGYQVARWRGDYDALHYDVADAALVMIGPGTDWLVGDEASALKGWVAGGGLLLVISREPQAQFEHSSIHAQMDYAAADSIRKNPSLDEVIDKNSDVLISQPTVLTRNARGLAVSRLAARLKFQARSAPPSAETVVVPDSADETASESDNTPESAPPPPEAGADSGGVDDENEPSFAEPAPIPADGEPFYHTDLLAPVVHLGDNRGAVLADFDYGRGRVIFLSDPFIVSNYGIGNGANLTLALNLINALGGKEKRIYFDEALHGYKSISNPVFTYFRGTPVIWVTGQIILIALLVAYSFSRRFARPLPLPQLDRHSPLEFVSSMANLQQAARSRDLALENIYPRFRARLCRRLGLSGKAKPDEVAAALGRRHMNISAPEVRQVMLESERALAGGVLDDQRLISLVVAMRRIMARFTQGIRP